MHFRIVKLSNNESYVRVIDDQDNIIATVTSIYNGENFSTKIFSTKLPHLIMDISEKCVDIEHQLCIDINDNNLCFVFNKNNHLISLKDKSLTLLSLNEDCGELTLIQELLYSELF